MHSRAELWPSRRERDRDQHPREFPRHQNWREFPVLSQIRPGSPRFAAAGRAVGPGLSALALLGFVLVEHRLSRGLPLGAELGAVVAAPLEGRGTGLVRPAEMRHHIAGVELV